MNLEKKRENEKATISKMIHIYCKNCHTPNINMLCEECQNLLDYSFDKIDNCPVIDTKSFCSSCPVHCYNEQERDEIRKVMKYSGPRMLYYDPLLAIKHLLITLKERWNRK